MDMKQAKRIFAMLLSVMLVFSLAGCGKKDTKDKNVFTEISEMSDITKGKSDIEASIKVNDKQDTLKSVLNTDTIKVKISSYAKDEKTMSTEVQADIGSGYQSVTDVVLKGNVMYVNTSKIIKFIFPLLENYAGKDTLKGLTADQVNLLIGSDYISFTEDDLKELSESTDKAKVDTDEMLKLSQKYQKVFAAAASVANDKVIPKINEVKDVLGKDGDNYTFTLNKDNAEALIKKITEILNDNGSDILNSFLDKIKDSLGEKDDLYKSIADKKSDIESKMKNLAKSLKGLDVSDFTKAEPKFILSANTSGDKGKRKGEIKLTGFAKDDTTNVDFTISSKLDEGGEGSVDIPSNSVSYSDFSSKLGLDSSSSSTK